MKHLLFFLAIPLLAQNAVNVGMMAMPADSTSAVQSFLINQSAQAAVPLVTTIGIGDSTIATLPAGVTCAQSLPVLQLSVASNVATATVQTFQVPTGTQVILSNAVAAGINGTYTVTGAPAQANLIFGLTIANGANYQNASPVTNGFISLTYARCALLVDAEVIQVTGFNPSLNSGSGAFTITRGDLGTTAAAHTAPQAGSSNITVLLYADLRTLYRAAITDRTATILKFNPPARLTTLLNQIASLQAQAAAIQASGAQ